MLFISGFLFFYKVIVNGRIADRGNHDELIIKQGRCFDLLSYKAKI
jgi:ABC-type multidrug transport system fused ATPase/permease subunit